MRQEVLEKIILEYGTPSYVFDLDRSSGKGKKDKGLSGKKGGNCSLLCHESQSIFWYLC